MGDMRKLQLESALPLVAQRIETTAETQQRLKTAAAISHNQSLKVKTVSFSGDVEQWFSVPSIGSVGFKGGCVVWTLVPAELKDDFESSRLSPTLGRRNSVLGFSCIRRGV